jgi:hypothetical protein
MGLQLFPVLAFYQGSARKCNYTGSSEQLLTCRTIAISRTGKQLRHDILHYACGEMTVSVFVSTNTTAIVLIVFVPST